MREIPKGFAVNSADALDNLHAHGAEQRAVVAFNDLKFGGFAFQFSGRQMHGGPERLQDGKIIHRRTANAMGRSRHWPAI